MSLGGWILLDKPSGISSRGAGARVARMFGFRTFGHVGTLDPMASGVLPIALGNATKMIPFIEEVCSNDKEYLFSLQFGFETDTLDAFGTVIARTDVVPSQSVVVDALGDFIGDVYQTPPAYSAVHINGRRAYELARHGIVPDIPVRRVHIYSLELVEIRGASWFFVCVVVVVRMFAQSRVILPRVAAHWQRWIVCVGQKQWALM